MPSSNSTSGAGTVRTSRRLRNEEPEFDALVDPETVLKENCSSHNISTPEQKRRGAESSQSDSEDFEEPTTTNNITTKVRQYANGKSQERLNEKEYLRHSYVSSRLEASRPSNIRPVKTYSSVLLNKVFICLFPVLIIGVVRLFVPCNDSGEKSPLSERFPGQDKRLWNFVSSGKKTTEPFVLLLVHDDLDNLTETLAKQIAADVVFSRTKMSLEPHVIDGKEPRQDQLLLVKPHIVKSHSLVLLNVHELSSKVAGDLHFILDVHEPWVPGAVYILSVNIPNVDNNPRGIYETIHSFLTEKWSRQIKADDLEPLIVRISNFEYVVKKDKKP